MPEKKSTADKIIELCNQFGVSIFLDGSDESDTAKIGSPYSFEPNDRILTIFLVNLRPNTWEKLKPFLKDKWSELGFAFDNEKEEVLDSVIEYSNDDPHSKLIDIFIDKIPAEDLTVLKLSLYLRTEKEKGHSIDQFKQEIWEKFGERGTYISNLCNSGYFEEDFAKAANVMTEIEFSNYYDSMVDKELKAIFVHSRLKAAAFRDKFEDTFLRARKYNISSFRIHGFGSWNVNLITNFFDSYINDDDGLWGEFSIITVENTKYPPSIIYEIVIE
jgi:hypothetical protein